MMKKMVGTALSFVFLTFVAANADTIDIGSSNPGSITYSASTAIAKLLTGKFDRQVRVLPHGGQSAFVPAINSGEVDLGAANAFETADGVNGTGIYEGRVLDKLRVVAVLMPLRNVFWVAEKSDIKSISDLKGKKVPGVWTSQKTIQVLTQALLANGGLTYDDVDMVPVVNVNRGADDFIQNRLDTFFFAVGAGKVMEAGSKVGGLRALPVDPSPEAMARERQYLPVMYPLQVQPSKANYGIAEPTYVQALDFLLLTNETVPEDVIYEITKALHGGKKQLFDSFKPLGANFSPELMAKKLDAGVYHPGAVRFYKEVGLWPPKQ
jgi:TRAP transporter TAXI family solute receptor